MFIWPTSTASSRRCARMPSGCLCGMWRATIRKYRTEVQARLKARFNNSVSSCPLFFCGAGRGFTLENQAVSQLSSFRHGHLFQYRTSHPRARILTAFIRRHLIRINDHTPEELADYYDGLIFAGAEFRGLSRRKDRLGPRLLTRQTPGQSFPALCRKQRSRRCGAFCLATGIETPPPAD